MERTSADSDTASSESRTGPQATPAISAGFLNGIGTLLFLGGVAIAVYYFAYFDTSVATPTVEIFGQRVGGERVVNLGLMEKRQTGLMLSVLAAILGLVALISGQRAKRKE